MPTFRTASTSLDHALKWVEMSTFVSQILLQSILILGAMNNIFCMSDMVAGLIRIESACLSLVETRIGTSWPSRFLSSPNTYPASLSLSLLMLVEVSELSTCNVYFNLQCVCCLLAMCLIYLQCVFYLLAVHALCTFNVSYVLVVCAVLACHGLLQDVSEVPREQRVFRLL